MAVSTIKLKINQSVLEIDQFFTCTGQAWQKFYRCIRVYGLLFLTVKQTFLKGEMKILHDEILTFCAAYIGIGGMKIENEPRH
jgi:hypothetical protein